LQNRNLIGIPLSPESAINMPNVMNEFEPINPGEGRANSVFVRSTEAESRPVPIRFQPGARDDAASAGRFLILLRQQRNAPFGLARRWGRTVAEP